MTTAAQLEQLGTEAVQQLRITRLRKGQPFLISSHMLPDDQSYLEFPEGRIVIVTYTRNAKEFTVLRELTNTETANVRKHFDLDQIVS